jgi:glycosyltransferase (activator-dependent family)
MRVLFTIIPSTSHLYPIIPLAGALQGAGHEVCVASHPDMVETITATGLTAVAVGQKEFLASVVRSSDGLHRVIADILADGSPDDQSRRPPRQYLLSAFSLYYPAEPPSGHRPMVDDLVDFARSWQPDLIIWDPLCLPSPIAARACGAAHARLLWGLDDIAWTRARLVEKLSRPGEEQTEDVLAALMKPTLDRFGYEFDEEMLVGQWTIDPMPPRMRLPLDLRSIPVRSVPYNGAAVLPEWLRARPERPRVCLTLGVSMRKFFAEDSDVSLTTLFEMVAGLDVELVATLNATQLADAGAVPDNVRLVDYVPLTMLLPTCSAIIHHGGGGTFATAVANKVPQLITPEEGADFEDIANYVVERGAGLAVDPARPSADAVRKQLLRILTEPSFAEGAAALFEDMLATPSPNDIVPVLEKLTARHRVELVN